MAGDGDEADPAAARDMAALFKGREEEAERPDDAQWPEWSGYIRDAWNELINDRHIGAMGGQGRIWFASIDRYAERYGYVGSEFDDFRTFLRAVDDEYLKHAAEAAKAESEKRKNGS